MARIFTDCVLKTGKTFTLVEIIRQLVLVQKKKVLICGASNLAVGEFVSSNFIWQSH